MQESQTSPEWQIGRVGSCRTLAINWKSIGYVASVDVLVHNCIQPYAAT